MLKHPVELSIIVPIYNVEAYLPRCIDSILAQTFTDFELILVDDGSPDRCGQLCDAYARQDPRIRVIHKKNGGLSDARNAGLDIATGRYIGFIDSDDSIAPQMYQRLISLLEAHQADIAATGFQNRTHDEQVLSTYPQLPNVGIYHHRDLINDFYPDIKWTIFPSACNKVYRRELFDDLRYPVAMLYEDSRILLPLFDRCDTIVVDTEHHYFYYVQRDGSIMNAVYTSKKFQLIDVALQQYEFFVKKGLPSQQEYALDVYATNYMTNFFAVYIGHRELVKEFAPHKKKFREHHIRMMKNLRICTMKKVVIVMMSIHKGLAYRFCRHFFPECLPEFLRMP